MWALDPEDPLHPGASLGLVRRALGGPLRRRWGIRILRVVHAQEFVRICDVAILQWFTGPTHSV